MKKYIVILSSLISLIAIGSFAADIKIADKTLTPTQYSTLKTDLITKYQTKGFFTPNEWQTYVAVLDKEAKEGRMKDIKVSGDFYKSINEKIK